MVEPQPSKLVMRVRFPSPAPMLPSLVAALFRVSTRLHLRSTAFRAINGPLADRHQDASGAIAIVWLAALGLHVCVNVAGDDFVRAARLMLVDHGGPLVVVTHAGHQILDPRAASGSEGVTRMAKVVEMQPLGTH